MKEFKNGQWVDGVEPDHNESYVQFIADCKVILKYSTLTQYVKAVKNVGMSELGELLPASVLIELEDYKRLSATAQPKREAAARVLTRINSNYPVDVLHADFVTLMGQLVDHTDLTQPEADDILIALQGE